MCNSLELTQPPTSTDPTNITVDAATDHYYGLAYVLVCVKA